MTNTETSSKRKHERRKRLKRPWTLVVFGIAFLCLPFINYISIASVRVGFTGTLFFKLAYHGLVLKHVTIPELVLMLAAFPVGVGLLLVTKWGWRLFMLYSATLVAYNLIAFFTAPVFYNMGALFLTAFGTVAMAYFIRKDISAPYMKMYPRGWRMEKREPFETEVFVNDVRLLTRDLSPTGFYAEWPDCPLHPGDSVKVRFELGGGLFEVQGGVVRTDATGAGIAFRNLNTDTSDFIRNWIERIMN